MSRFQPRTITIVGLGLIGGSLAAACRRKFPRAGVVGVSRSRSALGKAKRRGWIHEGTTNLAQGLRRADFVVLCTPVDTLKGLLRRIDRLAQPGTLVTDTGSVKGFLVRWADRQTWLNIHFAGAHPMAGSHERGIDHAHPHLFDHAFTFITPPGPSGPKGRRPGRLGSQSSLRLVAGFWKKLSKRVVILSPEEHDRLTAQVSHLPHLLAALLVASTPPKALGFAASGFLDATRIAQGDPNLWVPIFLENRKELYPRLQKFSRAFERLGKFLKKGDSKRLRQILTQAQKRRRRI